MALKKTLTGWDFCECPPCEERGNEIYPTTSDDQVIIDGLGSNLAIWLNIGRDGTYYTSLYSWLQANYPNSSYTLPAATDSTLGGVIVDTTNLTISNDGVLSVDVSSLNIPSIVTATSSASGTVKLGNSTTLTSNFSDGIISGQVHDAYSYSGHVYALPLRLDAQGRAGVAVPTDLFAVNQSEAASTWTFDWSKKVTNVSIGTPTSGVETNYILLGNKDVNTANGELGYNDDGELSTSCGYPRLALVAGNGITMTRFTNKFISPNDNYWGGNITEILIDSTGTAYTAGEGINFTGGTTINQSVATSDTLGGIKVGYTDNGDLRAVLLDGNNRAYVNVTNDNLRNHEVTNITWAVHYVDTGSSRAHFDTYNVKCKISDENLTVVNVNDFKKTGSGFGTIMYPLTDPQTGELIPDPHTYTWKITTPGSSNRIAVIDTNSTAAKGCFQLHINNDNGIEATHIVGFVIDTSSSAPGTQSDDSSFAWFSTCNWEVDARYVSGNNNRVYLVVPSDFTGTISITDKYLITAAGSSMKSMSGNNKVSWLSDEDIEDGSTTEVVGTPLTNPHTINGYVVVPKDYKVSVDAFVTLPSSPSVGDLLYDSEINDTLLHNLLTRVKTIELWIQNHNS